MIKFKIRQLRSKKLNLMPQGRNQWPLVAREEFSLASRSFRINFTGSLIYFNRKMVTQGSETKETCGSSSLNGKPTSSSSLFSLLTFHVCKERKALAVLTVNGDHQLRTF